MEAFSNSQIYDQFSKTRTNSNRSKLSLIAMCVGDQYICFFICLLQHSKYIDKRIHTMQVYIHTCKLRLTGSP